MNDTMPSASSKVLASTAHVCCHDEVGSAPVSLRRFAAASRDVDEACGIAGHLYYPLSMKLHDRQRRFGMELNALRSGPLTIGLVSFASDVECATGILGAYEVNIPITGKLLAGSGPDRVVASRSVAALCRADRDSVIRMRRDEPCQMLAIKIERDALEGQLEQLIGGPVRGPIEFDLALDVGSGRGRQWRAVAGSLAAQVYDKDSIFQHPLIAAPLAQSFMIGLLLAGRHNYTERILGVTSPERCAPATITRAREYIEAHLDEPLSALDIAQACGISLRALQQGFHSSMQTTPMRYLRELRLRKVREDLLAAEPGMTGVAEIAHRWGFGHLGRFAGHYRVMYGECPSAALRAG